MCFVKHHLHFIYYTVDILAICSGRKLDKRAFTYSGRVSCAGSCNLGALCLPLYFRRFRCK